MSCNRSGVHRGPQMTPAGSVGARKNSTKLATTVTITTEIALITRRRMYSSTAGTSGVSKSWHGRKVRWGCRWPGRRSSRATGRSATRGSALQVHLREERHAHGRVADGATDVGAGHRGHLGVVPRQGDVLAHQLLVQRGPLAGRLVGR